MFIRQQAQFKAQQEYYNQSQVQLFNLKINQEKQKLRELHRTIKQLKDDLQQEQGIKEEKQLLTKGLQLKLDGLKQKKNVTEGQCLKLKDEINYIRKEKQLVKQQYSKIVNDIQGQQYTNEFIVLDQSNLARSYILEGYNELKYTHNQLDSEKKNFENYFSQQSAPLDPFPINKTALIPKKKQKLNFNYLELSKMQQQIAEQEEQIENIVKECGCQSKEKAIQQFYEVEEQNYKMFNELNELVNEETFLNEYKQKIIQQNISNLPIQKQQTQAFVSSIKNLKDKKKKIEIKASFQETKWFRIKNKLEKIRDLIYDACQKLSIPIREQKEEIKYKNLEKWLSIIEKFLTEFYLKEEIKQEKKTNQIIMVGSNQSSQRYIPVIKQKTHRKIDNYQLKAQDIEKSIKFENDQFVSYDEFRDGISKMIN